jgi:hypothetical protein
MAVTETKLSSQGSSGSASGTDNGTVKASYRSAYRVACSSPADTIDEVLHHFRTTPSLPWMGRKFKFGNGFNASVLCKTIDVDQVENGDGRFIARCTFESPESQQQNQGQGANGLATDDPTRFHDEIEVSYQTIAIPVEKAKLWGYDPIGTAGSASIKPGYVGPIINSCGDPADPTLEQEMRIKVLRITKYLPAYDDSFFEAYANAVNNDIFTINKPQYNFRMRVGLYKARFGSRSATFGMAGNIKYYRVTGELLISGLPYGWFQLVPDRGRNRDQSPGKKNNHGVTISPGDTSVALKQLNAPILDADGNPILDPVLLDGSGDVHEKKKPPIYFIWQTFDLKPFSPIQW